MSPPQESYIMKADLPLCRGKSCLVCEMYFNGFISRYGGIIVLRDSYNMDGAEMAEQFCPSRCIHITQVEDEKV